MQHTRGNERGTMRERQSEAQRERERCNTSNQGRVSEGERETDNKRQTTNERQRERETCNTSNQRGGSTVSYSFFSVGPPLPLLPRLVACGPAQLQWLKSPLPAAPNILGATCGAAGATHGDTGGPIWEGVRCGATIQRYEYIRAVL